MVTDLNGVELKALDVVTISTPNGVIRDRIQEIGEEVVVLTFGEDVKVGRLERYQRDPDQSWK